MSWVNLLAIAMMACFASAGVATAELYRCVRADGSTVYTDSKATCPGAKAHHPTGVVQNYRSPAPAPARAAVSLRAERAALIDRSQAASEASWRRKKQQTIDELEKVTKRIGNWKRFVTHCNRGGSLYRTKENGLRTGLSCDWLRREVPTLENRRDVLQEYLDHGLREDCRKSGCLPGWLR